MRYEVNAVMPATLAHSQGLQIGLHLNLLVYTIPEIACARGGEEGRGAGRRRGVCWEEVKRGGGSSEGSSTEKCHQYKSPSVKIIKS